MSEEINKRVLKEAKYMVKTKNTIREVAKNYNVSKSTVHKDLAKRLKDIDSNLAISIDEILKKHKEERHIRGGEVTKQKYKKR